MIFLDIIDNIVMMILKELVKKIKFYCIILICFRINLII